MKKIILIVGILVAIFGLAFWLSSQFSAGSYPYAEQYQLNVDEQTAINTILAFKSQNTEYNIPKHLGLEDGRGDSTDHWYHIYFYYTNENQIVYAWTRPSGTKTTFAFVAMNKGLTLGNWKNINKDFSKQENQEWKKKFEERILNKVRLQTNN